MFLCWVYCYTPTYQGKFLVCENLLGNKPDYDSDLAAILEFARVIFETHLNPNLPQNTLTALVET